MYMYNLQLISSLAYSVFCITHTISIYGKHGLCLWETRRIINLANSCFSSSFTQIQPGKKTVLRLNISLTIIAIVITIINSSVTLNVTGIMIGLLHHTTYLVVDACAMMFPPIGFLGSAWNMDAPSTWATTWFVITTATPNWTEKCSNAVSQHMFYFYNNTVILSYLSNNNFSPHLQVWGASSETVPSAFDGLIVLPDLSSLCDIVLWHCQLSWEHI